MPCSWPLILLHTFMYMLPVKDRKRPSNSRYWHFKYLAVMSEIMITPVHMNEAPYSFQFPLLLYPGWKTDCSSASTPCFFFPFGRFFLSFQTQLSSQEEGRRSTYCCNLEEPYSRPIFICLVSCSKISFAICTHPLPQVLWSFQLSLFHQDLSLPASPSPLLQAGVSFQLWYSPRRR